VLPVNVTAAHGDQQFDRCRGVGRMTRLPDPEPSSAAEGTLIA
jgi:hypothetical protein